MANSKSCTHIKVTGVRCGSPALLGEQFCYFHQHAYRGVRHPSHSRLHPVALIESEEAIQASLMEVINGLIRNTLDVKRAELIIRALNIATKNVRHTRFDSTADRKVREVPQYAEPKAAVDELDSELPAVAAVPYRPVDPRDPHFLERFEEGGRILARQAAERRAAEAKTPAANVPPQATVNAGKAHVGTAAATEAHVGTAAPGCPGREATATNRKPPFGVKAPPQGRRSAAREAGSVR